MSPSPPNSFARGRRCPGFCRLQQGEPGTGRCRGEQGKRAGRCRAPTEATHMPSGSPPSAHNPPAPGWGDPRPGLTAKKMNLPDRNGCTDLSSRPAPSSPGTPATYSAQRKEEKWHVSADSRTTELSAERKEILSVQTK